MKAYLTMNPLGVFALDEKGVLIAKELFKGKFEKVAWKLRDAEEGLIEEEKRIISLLEDYELIIEKPVDIQEFKIQNPNAGGEYLRENFGLLLKEQNYSEEKYCKLLHDVCMAKARSDLEAASKREDKHVIQAIACLQDLDETLNVLIERAREWHGLAVPRFEEITADQRALFEKIAIGDDAALRDFGGAVVELQKYRGELEEHINEVMTKIAPNLTALAGPLLGARLIALAKGLENLAYMPGSRIQILGAGRAFFKGKRKKRQPPKHGAIYQHPLIKGSPWWHRGKIARSLGSKMAIAARVDAFSGNYVGEKLKEDFHKRVERIRLQYPKAPKKMRIIRRSGK